MSGGAVVDAGVDAGAGTGVGVGTGAGASGIGAGAGTATMAQRADSRLRLPEVSKTSLDGATQRGARIRYFLSSHRVACGNRARDNNQSLVHNIGGHGDHSCVVGALGGRPARKMATTGGSHRKSHWGRAIRHFPR